MMETMRQISPNSTPLVYNNLNLALVAVPEVNTNLQTQKLPHTAAK